MAVILAIIVFALYLFFYLKPLMQFRKDQRKIESLLDPDNPTTDDLRIFSKLYVSKIYKLGNDFDYIKFQFTDNESVAYMRNSLPGVYSGPFLIKEKVEKNYSYLAKFKITKFSASGSDVKIEFRHYGFLGMIYKFHLQDVSAHDINLLQQNLG